MNVENSAAYLESRAQAFRRSCELLATCRHIFQDSRRVSIEVTSILHNSGTPEEVKFRILDRAYRSELGLCLKPDELLMRGIELVNSNLALDLEQAGRASLVEEIRQEVQKIFNPQTA